MTLLKISISDFTVKLLTNYGERMLRVIDIASYSNFLARQFRSRVTVLRLARNLTSIKNSEKILNFAMQENYNIKFISV
jgi:hypothetical protein